MARWQYTLILDGFGKGASESFMLETGDDLIATAYALLPMVREKRAALLADGWSVKGDRMAMKRTTAGLKVKKPSRVREGSWKGNAAQVAISVGASLKVLWSNAAGTNVKLAYMAGAWESINPHQNIYNPEGTTWLTKFNDYTSVLKGAKAGWLSNLSPDPTPIIGYVFNPANGITTYTMGEDLFLPEEFNKPLKVGVEFPFRRSPLDGPQLVIPLTATTAKTATPRPSQPFTIEGRMRRYVLSFVHCGAGEGQATGEIVIQRITGRKRGRPLLVSPGRAPDQARW